LLQGKSEILDDITEVGLRVRTISSILNKAWWTYRGIKTQLPLYTQRRTLHFNDELQIDRKNVRETLQVTSCRAHAHRDRQTTPWNFLIPSEIWRKCRLTHKLFSDSVPVTLFCTDDTQNARYVQWIAEI
jgi:hypothetical protein